MVSTFLTLTSSFTCDPLDLEGSFFNIRLAANPDYYLIADIDAALILEHKNNAWFDNRKTYFTFNQAANNTVEIQEAGFDFKKLATRMLSTDFNSDIRFDSKASNFNVMPSSVDITDQAYWEGNVNFDEITFQTITGESKTRYLGFTEHEELYVYSKEFHNDLRDKQACIFKIGNRFLTASGATVRAPNCVSGCENETLRLESLPDSAKGKVLRTFLTKSSFLLEKVDDKIRFSSRTV